ncbi:MAG: ABC transporter ATP-binding protein [Clostridiales bacterium]|jgi:simple sugar transport system ATP-binding protein|nr:ABC transporter ATP-binding protein [Clostridiales bacterium]
MEKRTLVDDTPLGGEALSMQHITKIYSNGFVANNDVTFAVRKGEIHGLVGENGAGKTTLMKALFGQEQTDGGRVLIGGREVKIESPQMALEYGIGMVHQHFMLVQSLTVAESMTLGAEPRRFGALYDFKKAVEMTRAISEKYELPIDPHKRIRDLSVGYKQRVEILKILLRGAKVLLMDEPTAVLTPQETKELFVQLKNLRDRGYTIVFISHKLHEVKEICDRITVLRRGRVIGAAEISEVSEGGIARMMVGRDVYLNIEKSEANPGKPALSVKGVSYRDASGAKALDNVSFDVREGEILGVAGVEGNGQAELSELIAGLLKLQEGDITINGKSIRDMSIGRIRQSGLSLIHEDRMTYGTNAVATVAENIISDRRHKPEYQSRGFLRRKAITEKVTALIDEFRVKCDGPDAETRTLSGGNIQKVVAAREFSSEPKALLAGHPTRGIDVGASELVRNKIVELRDKQRTAVLLISADLSEILSLSDSIIVLYNGRVAARFPDVSAVDETILGEYMLGVKTQEVQSSPEGKDGDANV